MISLRGGSSGLLTVREILTLFLASAVTLTGYSIREAFWIIGKFRTRDISILFFKLIQLGKIMLLLCLLSFKEIEFSKKIEFK